MAREQSAVKMELLSGDTLTLCIHESSRVGVTEAGSRHRSQNSLVQPCVVHFEGDTFMGIDRNGSAVTDISDEQPRVGRAGNVRESEASISSCYVTLIEHQLREYMGGECARLEAAYTRIGQPHVVAVEHCGTNRPRRDDGFWQKIDHVFFALT